MKGSYIYYVGPMDSRRPLDAGLRMTTFYDIGSDCTGTRLDLMIDDKQYNIGLMSSIPMVPGLDANGLITLKNVECTNLKVNKDDLIAALVMLVNDLSSEQASDTLAEHKKKTT